MDRGAASETPKVTRREDYRPPNFLIEEVELDFELVPEETVVKSRLSLVRNGDHDRPLVLDGEDLDLGGLWLEGRPLGVRDYELTDEALIIPAVPDSFMLEVETIIDPSRNTQLSGLYFSGGNFCTQCEAEGFRRITYFLDRPDVLARYSVTLRADKEKYPVLLSNGNLEASRDFEDGRHEVTWRDPFPKPSYLFALVAGDLVQIADSFKTASGREVALHIYVALADADKCGHAMESLKKAMRWDEETYGLEYDLDVYNIVAVSDFNMGAMENKSLNIFNTRYVLARPDTATDADFDAIEAVIAHEYFHNWTGNRVTCRDWFQLSLKEGLTVYRDQEFSADMGSRGVKRIEDVRRLRETQFPEDAGPMAHPVRPDSYIEINNFYTATVYNKGAEVIRMMEALLGKDGFRRGMDLYFERHDGEAVTCDDFAAAMADANDRDFAQLKLWYAQAGTPRVDVETDYDADAQALTLRLKQHLPTTPDQMTAKKPMVIPLKTALLGPNGATIEARLDGNAAQEHLVILTSAEQEVRFEKVSSQPVASILRGFSAPVILETDHSREELAFLARHDDDPFNRWEAIQKLAAELMLEAAKGDGPAAPSRILVEAIASTLDDRSLDPALKAEAVVLPTESWLGERMEIADYEALHKVRKSYRKSLSSELEARWRATYDALKGEDDKAARKLKNIALGYLVASGEGAAVDLAYEQFESAENMTDELAALVHLASTDTAARVMALDAFYEKWRSDALVLDKWFGIQATSQLPDTLDRVMALAKHPDFTLKNPNRFRALVASFAMANPVRFHDEAGRGYRFLADMLIALDPINPQTAARLLTPLGRWRKVDPKRAARMREEIERILKSEGLSKDSYEIAAKSLGR